MAGPWLKMECATPDKPEVLAITAALGWDDPDTTVGKLFRMWRWFDQHTLDGNAAGVTSALLDRIVGVTGFAQAVANVKWLTITEDGITLTNFDKHNGETAKQRALTAKRVAEHKANAKGNADGNDEGNGVGVTSALPRGRGRGRDISTSLRSVDSAKRATRKCPDSFDVSDDLVTWARQAFPAIDLASETAAFRDHTFKNAISDWDGAWRNWMRKADQYKQKQATPGETAYQRSMRERVAQAAGSMAHIVAAKPPGQTRPLEPWEEAIENRNQTTAIGMD